jgi:hypothetical protein
MTVHSILLYFTFEKNECFYDLNWDLLAFCPMDSTICVVRWSEFLAADPEIPGLIPGAARFSE